MIPFTLWQTAKTNCDINENFLKSWIIKNPALECNFMDDQDCRSFIKDNFSSEIYDVYTALPLSIMRADMWRIAVIYIHGGIYADTDVYCHKSIKPLLQDKDFVFCQEVKDRIFVSNFFFAAKPKHPLLKEVLDLMLEIFYKAFDTTSIMMVQNFGMDTIQQTFNKYTIPLISYNEINEYLLHHCLGTWRNDEREYKNKASMKPTTFFTTFNQNGYDLYGKVWIRTFIENVAPKSPTIKALVYAHNVKNLTVNHPQIEVIDYDEAIPEHSAWKEDFLKKSTHSSYVKDNTIRFSHKGLVIQHALDNILTGYAIWLDGDCIMHDASYDNFPNNLLKTSAIACQLEHARENAHHIESGILLFDMDNSDIDIFKEKLKYNYEINQVLTIPDPYDGFIIYRSIVDAEIKFNDLNEKYGIGGIQSCPTLTFLHPEVSVRFTHNIGLTGKSNYDNWEEIKYSDKIFSTLAAVAVLSPSQLKIHNLRAKKKLISG